MYATSSESTAFVELAAEWSACSAAVDMSRARYLMQDHTLAPNPAITMHYLAGNSGFPHSSSNSSQRIMRVYSLLPPLREERSSLTLLLIRYDVYWLVSGSLPLLAHGGNE